MSKFWIDANAIWYVTSDGCKHHIGSIDRVPELNRRKGNVQDDFADEVPEMVDCITAVLKTIDDNSDDDRDLEDITDLSELLKITIQYEELLSEAYTELEAIKDSIISHHDYFNIHRKGTDHG